MFLLQKNIQCVTRYHHVLMEEYKRTKQKIKGNQIKGKQGNQVMTKEKGLFNLTHFNFSQFTGCTKGKEFRK